MDDLRRQMALRARELPQGDRSRDLLLAGIELANHLERIGDDVTARHVKLMEAVAEHHAQKADDRCWMDDRKLYAAAGLPAADVTVESCSAMLSNCVRYVTLRMEGKAGAWKSYTELEAELAQARGELAAIRARVHEAYLRPADEVNPHAETGHQLVDRLRGIYTIPVNDGAGPLRDVEGASADGTTFTRRFPPTPINVEAAAEIERLRGELALAQAREGLYAPPSELTAFLNMLARAKVGHGIRPEYQPERTAVQVEDTEDDGPEAEFTFDPAGNLLGVSCYGG